MIHMKALIPPRHIVWSTSGLDLSDPFQKRWLLQQILTHGTADDIHQLDLEEVERELDHLTLPADIEQLWRSFFEYRNGC